MVRELHRKTVSEIRPERADYHLHGIHGKVDQGKSTVPNFHIHDHRGEHVFVTANRFDPEPADSTLAGRYIARCIIPGDFLNTGTFSISAALTFTDKGLHVSFYERSALMLHVTENLEVTLDGARLGYAGPIPGVVRPVLNWSIGRNNGI